MAKRKKSRGHKSKQAKARQPRITPKASSFQQQWKQASKLIIEGDLTRAEPLCAALIRHHPDDLHTLKVTGILRYYQHRYMEAISLLERVYAVNPQDIQTRRMLISSYQDGKQDEKAMSMARTLLNHPLTVEETMLAFNVFHELCDWQTSASMQDDLIRKIRAAGAKGITLGPSFLLALNGLDNTDPDTLFELHGFHGIRKPSVPLPRTFTPGQPNPRRRLKIAYLSPDFNTHPVAYFIYPVIAAHNRQNVEVYCYAHLARQDDITEKFREAADHFIDITAMTHAEAAQRIQADGIHVLIDLAGHTANSRLPVLRWKPAPVQVSWLGYPNTSGIPEVDFHITDHYAECEGGTRYTEQLLYMPESFICFGMRPTCLRAETAPVESTGFITFGSFANTRKMNPRVIGAWSRILNRVPNSRMALKARWKSDIVRDHVLAEFARHGVDDTRIIFLPVTDTYDEHVGQYNQIDIALDTFPYSGTTTTCEALLMGVPVVTLIGKTHANRVSYSILKNIAFEVTTAKTLDDYVDKAVNLAINPGGLSVLRKTLSTLFEYSIVGQPERFAPQLEALYMDAWNRKMDPTFKIPEKKNVSIETTHTEYEWIFITGMPRSGSTWCYNVTRSLLEYMNTGTPIGFVGEMEAVDKALQAPSFDGHPPHLIKFHCATKTSLNMLASGKARAIYSQRDLRDVAVSLIDFEHTNFYQLINGRLHGIMTTHEQWMQADSSCHIEYADIMKQPQLVIRKIVEFLDLKVDGKITNKIAEACSIEAVRKHTAAIKHTGSAYIHTKEIGSGRRYDTETLLHGNHITSGETGRYKRDLDSKQIDKLNSLLGNWLSKHGYETTKIESPDFSHNPGSDFLVIGIKNNVRICLPNSTQLMTPYVLLEQQDWFEDEIKFIRKLIKPGMHVLDIGANYGCYTLTIAKLIGKKGKLWAFEPSSTTADFLEQSVTLNKLHNVHLMRMALSDHEGEAELSLCENSELNALVQPQSGNANTPTETVPLRRLDGCMEELAWPNIDFIKLDAEGEEVRILQGGQTFFTDASPLIMFELKHGEQVNEGLIHGFLSLGYQAYRLVPGLSILAPFDHQEPADAYQLNLFCCKEDRAEELERLGFLTRPHPEEAVLQPQDQWQKWLRTFPFTKNLLVLWEERINKDEILAGWSAYENALDSFAMSQQNGPASARYAYLKHAFLQLVSLLDEFVNLPRLMSLARVATELGQREAAVQILNQIVEHFQHDPNFIPAEPFLAVSKEWENTDPDHRLGDWCLAQVLIQKEKLQAFSSYFTGTSSLPALDTIEELGYLDSEMARRGNLIRQRFGLQSKTVTM